MRLLNMGRQIIAILPPFAPVVALNDLGGFLPGFLRCQFSALYAEDTPRIIMRILTSTSWLVVTRCLHPLMIYTK